MKEITEQQGTRLADLRHPFNPVLPCTANLPQTHVVSNSYSASMLLKPLKKHFRLMPHKMVLRAVKTIF